MRTLLYGTGAWRNSSEFMTLGTWTVFSPCIINVCCSTRNDQVTADVRQPWNLPYKHCRKGLANGVGVQHKYLLIRARWNNDSVLCVSPYNRPWRSRGVNVHFYSFFNFGTRWWVGGQLHAPSSVPLGRRPGTHCTGSWVGPIAGLDGCRKSHHHQDSIPRLSSP